MFWRTAQRQLDLAALTIAGQASNSSAEALGKIDRHEDDCRKYREAMRRELADHRLDVNQRFDKQDEDRAKMHAENQQKFVTIGSNIDDLRSSILGATIKAAGSVILALLAGMGGLFLYLLSHGHP